MAYDDDEVQQQAVLTFVLEQLPALVYQRQQAERWRLASRGLSGAVMDAFARRLPYLIAWLQQALAVADGTACGIGVLADRAPQGTGVVAV